MVYKIITSSLGKATFHQNIDYLKREWSGNEIKIFIEKTDAVIEILKRDPFVFPKWEHDPEIRRVPIVKQVTLFYSIEKTHVAIHLFWNNYKNPDKLLDLL